MEMQSTHQQNSTKSRVIKSMRNISWIWLTPTDCR